MNVPDFLSRIESLTDALTILEGQFNDQNGEIEEKCIDLFTNLAAVKKSVNTLRNLLEDIVGQLHISEVKIEELREMKQYITHIKSYLLTKVNTTAQESRSLFAVRSLFPEMNDSFNTQNTVSPVPLKWVTQLASPSEPVQLPKQKSFSKSQDIPVLSYITDAEMNTVPKYMRGRFTSAIVNKLLDAFNETYKKKYETIYRPKKSVKPKDMECYYDWKREENLEPKGTYFVTVKDINSFGNIKMDKTAFNMVTILRHLKRIRETRHTNGQIHFIIV